MAIIFMDSFDGYGSSQVWSKYPAGGTGVPVIGTGGRRNTQCLTMNNNDNVTMGEFLSPQSTVIIGMAIRRNGVFFLPNPSIIRFYNNALAMHCELCFDDSYRLYLRRSDGTVLVTGTTIIAISAWYYLELKVKMHGSTGTANLRLNGIDEFNGTSLNTSVRSPLTVSFINVGSQNVGYMSIDDLYVCDTTGSSNTNFLGDIAVEYLVPTGAGAKTQFTPSSGSNWQTVDETTTVSDADYNSSSVPGAMDLFGMSNLSGNGLVYAVRTDLRGNKNDAGFRSIKPAFYKPSGVGDTARSYTGLQSPVSDTFSYLPSQIYNTSPDTGVAWTVDEVNALQYGYAVGDAGMFTLDAKLV